MTIKICHEKFSKRAERIGDVVLLFMQWFLPIFFLGGGIYLFLTFEGIVQVFGWVGIFAGLFTFVMIHIVDPWMWEKPTIFSKLNEKLKLFEWNEDC